MGHFSDEARWAGNYSNEDVLRRKAQEDVTRKTIVANMATMAEELRQRLEQPLDEILRLEKKSFAEKDKWTGLCKEGHFLQRKTGLDWPDTNWTPVWTPMSVSGLEGWGLFAHPEMGEDGQKMVHDIKNLREEIDGYNIAAYTAIVNNYAEKRQGRWREEWVWKEGMAPK